MKKIEKLRKITAKPPLLPSEHHQNAEAELAYSLQEAKERRAIRKEEIEIDVVQRRKQIEVEAREIERKDRELEATVRRPTEAEAYKVNTLAEGKRYVVLTRVYVFV